MKGIGRILFIFLAFSLIINVACSKKKTDPGAEDSLAGTVPSDNSTDKDSAGNEKKDGQDGGSIHMNGKQIIVYYPNWKLGRENGNVEDIPWDSVTMVNHAFWEVYPLSDENETSFERRAAGKEARTGFAIRSTLPDADKEIFAKYKEYHSLYPDVKIMISIGGWSRCGYFSEMAYTEEGRDGFVRSCIDLIKENDWIAGIDIDWEYPGGSNDGERKPENETDQGCPIFGTSLDDRLNFPALLKALREGLDSEFGKGQKLLTACASSSTGWTLPNQDWKSASEFLDYINIMTYDMAGDWDKQTGHASSVSGTKNAMAFFINALVDKMKLNLGIPYYGTGFKLAGPSKEPSGAKITVPNGIDKDLLTVSKVKEFEQEAVSVEETGWHRGYNENVGGAYLWNDDESSPYYCWYISYECLDAIDGKFALIEKYNLAGVLVWEITEDTKDHEYTKYLAEHLR